jgi:isoleucyl-tRNA synthetase
MEKNFKVNVAKSRLSVGFTHRDNEFLSLWENNDTFKQVNKSLSEKPFVLLDGPPYANGDAHLGHALNKMFKDLVVKSQWFLGNSVKYQPGWDCHGLPLELAVEKKYGKLDTETLKQRCKQLAFRSLVKQRKAFKSLGVLGDWDKPYVTLSKSMVKDSWKTLTTLLDKNLLEYKQYPVHYCPACASSLAEAELENKVLNKDSLYFKMKLEHKDYKNLYALVWTTTPWTLPMNQGLALHNDFNYEVWTNNTESVVLQNSQNQLVKEWLLNNDYNYVTDLKGVELVGSTAESPLTKNKVPVLHAHFVEADKTGFVHLAFAHGPDDFELGQANNLKPVTYLNNYGSFETELPTLSFLNTKKYTQVQSLVCDNLEKDNLLVGYSNQQVEQQVCWRHKCGVYYNATFQSFLKLEDSSFNLKDKVKSLLESSTVSQSHKERLSQMLLSRKSWCLSRQRKWGCPMNLLVHKKTHELNVDLSKEYLNLCYLEKEDEKTQFLEKNSDYLLFDDVLDVWFDSGNVVNNYAYNNDHPNDYVVDLALEGKDQFRGWFQSMLWLSVATNEVMPYKHVFSHGFVLDEGRNKFSKSSGNGNAVDFYLKEHGSDVLHLWVASQEPELDAVFSKNKLEEMKKYYSRLRLSLRFLSSNLYDYDYSKHSENLLKFKDEDSWDLHRFVLKEMDTLATNNALFFKSYQFKKALEGLYSFTDKTLSNFYFDWVKNPLYLLNQKSETRLAAQTALFEVLSGLFDLVKVFTPFVAEEFYQDFFSNNKSVLEEFYFNPNKKEFLNSLKTKVNWDDVQEARKVTQANLEPLQKNKTVKSRTEAGCNLFVAGHLFNDFEFVSKNYKLNELLGVSFVNLFKNDLLKVELLVLNNNEHYQKCPRCWNYELKENFHNELCHSCNTEEY